MTVNLGMPATPPPVLASRRPTRQIRVGKVLVGGDAPISVQSMTTTKTHDINATLQQIAELTASGCDIVRVACPRQEDADALGADFVDFIMAGLQALGQAHRPRARRRAAG